MTFWAKARSAAPKRIRVPRGTSRAQSISPPGMFFAWLAADDLLDPRFLEAPKRPSGRILTLWRVSPGSASSHRTARLSGEQRDLALASPELRVRLRSFIRRPRWTEVYCLYRRSALLESPRFTREPGADVLLTWWFLLRGRILVLDDLQLSYRVFPDKSLDDMATSLAPGARVRQWKRMRLWSALWRKTSDPAVDRETRWVARRELVTALIGIEWIKHNLADARLATQAGLSFARGKVRR